MRGPARLPLIGRHAAERLEQAGDGPLLAERSDAHAFERGEVAGAVHGGEELLPELVDVDGHVVPREW